MQTNCALIDIRRAAVTVFKLASDSPLSSVQQQKQSQEADRQKSKDRYNLKASEEDAR